MGGIVSWVISLCVSESEHEVKRIFGKCDTCSSPIDFACETCSSDKKRTFSIKKIK